MPHQSLDEYRASSRVRLASPIHLAGLIILLCGLTTTGILAQHKAAAAAANPSASQLVDHSQAMPFYISALVVNWGLFFYCYVGVRWNGGTLATLSGGRWRKPRDLFVDFLIAALLWGVFEGASYGMNAVLEKFFPMASAAGINALLPQTSKEVFLWIANCISAGICEEMIFRGYLQKQFLALSGSIAAAVFLQGIVFGISHGYQGWKNVAVISVLGTLYGLLAAWRGNLRANILSHAWSDIWEGWLKFLVFR
jgi:membrane protease YdiL (CAAX protease family)